MSSLQQVQNYLRQKKASGRLSDAEEVNAYKAYFGTEAGMNLKRSQHELDVRRVDITEKQNQQRIQMAQDEADRAEEANKVQGRMALSKIAVPDLFMYEGGVKDGGGGAQTASTQAVGSQGVQDGTPALSDPSLDISQQENQVGTGTQPEAVTDMEWGMKSVTGQSFGEHIMDSAGTAKQNLAAGVFGGGQAMLGGLAMRAAGEVLDIGISYLGKMFSSIPGIGSFFSNRKAPTQQQMTDTSTDYENMNFEFDDDFMNSLMGDYSGAGDGGLSDVESTPQGMGEPSFDARTGQSDGMYV